MRRLFLFVFILCFSQLTFAQRHELGIFAGGANVIGDVGKGNYFNPFPVRTGKTDFFLPISIGGLYRFNINPQMGFRANLSYSRVGAYDSHSEELYKKDRRKSFSNNIVEGSIVFEYNFFNINDDVQNANSPYIFFGLGAFSAKEKNYDYDAATNIITEKGKYKTNLSIPFGIGYKIKFNYNWILGFETGFRYTNVDYIDYNVGKFSDNFIKGINDGNLSKDEYNKRIWGNTSNKDWYVLSGITLTYSFGRPACYCD